MPQKRTSSTSKKNVQQKNVSNQQNKKRKSATRRKSKKNQKIPLYKTLVYCALAVAICILGYLIADMSGKTIKNEPAEIAKRYENDDKTSQQKNENKETKQENKIEKNQTEKSEQKKSSASETKKTEKNEQTQSSKNQKTETSKNNQSSKSSQTSNNSQNEQKNVEKSQNQKKEETQKQTNSQSQNEKSQKNENQKNENQTEQKNQNKKSEFDFPNAQNDAKLVFVFDDGGQNLSQLEKFINLPFPITVAVLPKLSHSVESANRVRNSGNELMLHQPMQSVNENVNPGLGAIKPEMDENQILSVLFENVNEIAPISGFNNHEGSAITADAEKMAVILRFASEEGIYFLDSRTNVETKVPYVANQMGYSYYERNIFLDNEKTRENVLNELKKGLVIANKSGQVIMIGHIWSANFLPAILEEVYPELTKKGYKFIKVSQAKMKN